MVIDYRGNLPNLWSVGVLNGDRDLLTIGAIPACYHFCYEYLEKLGYSRVSLGLCRAFINDGVLRFKRKFGLKILDATDRGFIFFPTRGSAAMEELLKKNAFISSMNGRLQLTTFTAPDGPADELQFSISKKFAESGLFASEIYQVAGSDIVKVSENTFDEASNIEKPRTSTTTTDRDECSRAALYLLRHLMHVRNDRTMLLYADELSHHDTMEVIVSSASKLGLEVECLLLDRAESLEQKARKIEQRLEEREFDVLLELSGQYFYNTPAWSRARQLGVRTFGLGPLDLKSLLTCVGQADHHKVYFLAERIRKILLKCSYVHISDSNGTDLTMRMSRPLSNQLLSKIRLIAPRYTAVNRPTGFLSNKVNSTFLGGQLSFLGFLPWTNGTLVVDAYLWPPKEIGCLKKKVTLEIGRGSIIGVDGGKEAELFSRLQPLSERNLEHICVGLNPGANIDRNLMEAERALGACNFGFGRYPHHTDAVISKPTLMADDIPIIDRGEVSRDI